MYTVREAILVPIHRAGWPFIAIFAAVSLLLFALAWPLGVLGALATAWCAWFFQNPVSLTPTGMGW